MISKLLAELEANTARNGQILRDLRSRLRPLFSEDSTPAAPAGKRPYNRATPEKIRIMHGLFSKGGSVRKVAVEVGLSPASVAREKSRWRRSR